MIALTFEQELKMLSIIKTFQLESTETKIKYARKAEINNDWFLAYALYRMAHKHVDAKVVLRIVLSTNIGNLYRSMVHDINDKASDNVLNEDEPSNQNFNRYIAKICLDKQNELYVNIFSNCSETMDEAIERIYKIPLPDLNICMLSKPLS